VLAVRTLTLTLVGLVVLAAVAVTQLPDEKEIKERVLSPSVQVAYFEGIGGAVMEWRVAGSGTVFKTKKGTYILTAGHVVSNAIRYVEKPPQPNEEHTDAKVAAFEDVMVIIERERDGIVTGELRLRCKILKYSPVEEAGGDDLAVLEPYEPELLPFGARPLPKDASIYAGQPVYHCGSMLGELVNSVTFGVVSSVSRMYRNKPFIQISTTAQPGSSGGGIFVVANGKCYYAGMLTRGTGENINLAVPLKRIRDNLAKWSMSFILDEAE
jgi:S1-C subfamily serine protease